MIWLVAIVATESITEILLESALFDKIKGWLSKWWIFNRLLACGWCLSVWIATAAFILIEAGYGFILIPFAIQRLANYLHDGYGLLKKIRWRNNAIQDSEKRG